MWERAKGSQRQLSARRAKAGPGCTRKAAPRHNALTVALRTRATSRKECRAARQAIASSSQRRGAGEMAAAVDSEGKLPRAKQAAPCLKKMIIAKGAASAAAASPGMDAQVLHRVGDQEWGHPRRLAAPELAKTTDFLTLMIQPQSSAYCLVATSPATSSSRACPVAVPTRNNVTSST